MPQIVVDSFPANISLDSFEVSVTVNGAKIGKNYLRIEIYKNGTTNYFGETFNGESWYGGSDGLSYFPIQIASSSASFSVQGRIGNPNISDYSGPGDYLLKIKRYTQSGNSASDDEVPVTTYINFQIQTPTVIPTPTAVPEIVSTPVPTAVVLVQTNKTPQPVLNIQDEENNLVISTPNSEIVLADETTNMPTSSVSFTASPSVSLATTFPFFPAILFAVGLFLLGIGFYLFYRKRN